MNVEDRAGQVKAHKWSAKADPNWRSWIHKSSTLLILEHNCCHFTAILPQQVFPQGEASAFVARMSDWMDTVMRRTVNSDAEVC